MGERKTTGPATHGTEQVGPVASAHRTLHSIATPPGQARTPPHGNTPHVPRPTLDAHDRRNTSFARGSWRRGTWIVEAWTSRTTAAGGQLPARAPVSESGVIESRNAPLGASEALDAA